MNLYEVYYRADGIERKTYVVSKNLTNIEDRYRNIVSIFLTQCNIEVLG